MPDDLDRILESAIKSYTAVEPSPELPQRILRRARQQTRPLRRSPWNLGLALALPLAAALTLAFALREQWALPTPPATITSVPSTPSMAVHTHRKLTEALTAATRETVQAHRKVRKTSWARPLPAPYSKEELTLLNFVQQHPKEAAEIAEAQKQQVADALKPISIAPIQIKPLTIAALD